MKGLSFDDVLLVPQHTDFAPDEVVIRRKLFNLSFEIPLFASPMDTVVNPEVAKACGEFGAMAVIHRAQNIEAQCDEVSMSGNFVGAAVGLGTKRSNKRSSACSWART